MQDFDINVSDTALILEGGGFRASYTAGAVVTLLEQGINFGSVYGISAGSSHAVDYISRDIRRTKEAFVDLVKDPNFGGVSHFLRHHGYFNAPYLYEGIAQQQKGTDGSMSFDFETFMANPAKLHIEALDRKTGETVAWTKDDMPTEHAMMCRVRACSSMPIAMPPTTVDGRTYVDGGMGSSWGIPLHAAMQDGFKKFFLVLTQEKDYRKEPPSKKAQVLMKTFYWRYPLVAKRILERWQYYNELRDEIEELRKNGQAYVFYPKKMTVSNHTRDFDALQESYDRGYAQAQRELSAWKEFLGL
ncbi:MAG: patatin-like phospholipase family protein [Eggerthellaceae bacterium]|jgi:predicted patatin/cPLA2 family phospholipase